MIGIVGTDIPYESCTEVFAGGIEGTHCPPVPRGVVGEQRLRAVEVWANECDRVR